jgi:hypothetical protein
MYNLRYVFPWEGVLLEVRRLSPGPACRRFMYVSGDKGVQEVLFLKLGSGPTDCLLERLNRERN